MASLDFESAAATSGHVLLALLENEAMARQAREASDEFRKLGAESLRAGYDSITADATISLTASDTVSVGTLSTSGHLGIASPNILKSNQWGVAGNCDLIGDLQMSNLGDRFDLQGAGTLTATEFDTFHA